jgi:hypothetical protein
MTYEKGSTRPNHEPVANDQLQLSRRAFVKLGTMAVAAAILPRPVFGSYEIAPDRIGKSIYEMIASHTKPH